MRKNLKVKKTTEKHEKNYPKNSFVLVQAELFLCRCCVMFWFTNLFSFFLPFFFFNFFNFSSLKIELNITFNLKLALIIVTTHSHIYKHTHIRCRSLNEKWREIQSSFITNVYTASMLMELSQFMELNQVVGNK